MEVMLAGGVGPGGEDPLHDAAVTPTAVIATTTDTRPPRFGICGRPPPVS
jgi:hypothetical protein